VESAKRWVAGDSFQNFEARVGYGTNNQTSGSGYSFDFISRNRVLLEAMYRSSWVVGAVVDVVADDMTRAGVEIKAGLAPEQKSVVHAAFERMALWDSINDTTKWSRLYGGAIGVMLIDGQNMRTPLNPDSIAPDQFKGILVLDRWLIQPTLNDLVTDLGPDLGKPKFYDIVADSMALARQRIHYSRVIRLDGVELPYWQKISENLWGQSTIERLFDRLIAFDSTTAGAAQLVYKAHLRTLSVDSLRELIGMGGPALEALLKNVEMIRRFQSNEGMTLIDAKDKFESHQYSFSGLDNVLLQFGQQLSGATGIPLVRLFGQSPAGLSATGDADIRNYYDNIKQQQERRLRLPLTRLLDVIVRSELGIKPPKDFQFSFNPLWQLSDTEKADVAQKNTDTVTKAYDSGLISQQTALKELRQSSEVSGVWSSIDDEMIEEADDELPDLTEMNPDDPNAGQETQPEPKQPAANA
jgi:phage-related protein (TIGR01555 family)